MNEQKAPNGIEWTRIKRQDGTVLRGYTWNPVGGCMHGCRWTMPDGTTAVCYAEVVAERVAMKAYPHGFAHHYWSPERLQEPLKLKESAGIFLDSMSDLMGAWVPDEQVEAVLDVCRQASHHTFMLLTKNAPRLLRFKFPPNVWVGVSSPPDVMFGKPLSSDQRSRMLIRSLDVLARVDVPVRWMSFEPLSWDVTPYVAGYPGALQWAVIGAASAGREYFPPDDRQLDALLDELADRDVPVFFKGNMKSSLVAVDDWRDSFPVVR